jgi:hypothetical protein
MYILQNSIFVKNERVYENKILGYGKIVMVISSLATSISENLTPIVTDDKKY